MHSPIRTCPIPAIQANFIGKFKKFYNFFYYKFNLLYVKTNSNNSLNLFRNSSVLSWKIHQSLFHWRKFWIGLLLKFKKLILCTALFSVPKGICLNTLRKKAKKVNSINFNLLTWNKIWNYLFRNPLCSWCFSLGLVIILIKININVPIFPLFQLDNASKVLSLLIKGYVTSDV